MASPCAGAGAPADAEEVSCARTRLMRAHSSRLRKHRSGDAAASRLSGLHAAGAPPWLAPPPACKAVASWATHDSDSRIRSSISTSMEARGQRREAPRWARSESRLMPPLNFAPPSWAALLAQLDRASTRTENVSPVKLAVLSARSIFLAPKERSPSLSHSTTKMQCVWLRMHSTTFVASRDRMLTISPLPPAARSSTTFAPSSAATRFRESGSPAKKIRTFPSDAPGSAPAAPAASAPASSQHGSIGSKSSCVPAILSHASPPPPTSTGARLLLLAAAASRSSEGKSRRRDSSRRAMWNASISTFPPCLAPPTVRHVVYAPWGKRTSISLALVGVLPSVLKSPSPSKPMAKDDASRKETMRTALYGMSVLRTHKSGRVAWSSHAPTPTEQPTEVIPEFGMRR